MTPEQVTLVKSSWEKVVPIADKAAELFYGKLFELDPSVKPLFKGDMVEQGAKLMKMIGTSDASWYVTISQALRSATRARSRRLFSA